MRKELNVSELRAGPMSAPLPENVCIVDVFLEAFTLGTASALDARGWMISITNAPACLSMGL